MDNVHAMGEKAVGYVMAFGFGFLVAMIAFGG